MTVGRISSRGAILLITFGWKGIDFLVVKREITNIFKLKTIYIININFNIKYI